MNSHIKKDLKKIKKERISAPEGSTRTYGVYQIFTGDLSEGILSNVKWGKNAKLPEGAEIGKLVSEEILGELTAVNSASDIDKLNVIKQYVDLNSDAIGTVSNGSPLRVPTGYYLIKDNGEVGEGESYSLYVVEVVGPTTISPKTGTTEFEKKVKDTNDTIGETSGWQDSADYDIGDNVPFQLKATLPENVDKYETYKVVFHDTLSKGLTYNEDAKVYINGVEAGGFTPKFDTNSDGITTLTFSCDDVKKLGAGNKAVITVEYTAELNNEAVIGSAGNPNDAYLEYSNNPNDEGTGVTPNDTVIVFTYKIVVNKITENPDYKPEEEGSEEFIPLKGAGFTLYKKSKEFKDKYIEVVIGTDDEGNDIKELKGDDMTTFEWKGLDDGDYKLVETTTPAGYNTIADILFSITAEHEIKSDNPALTGLSGDVTSGSATFTPSVDNCSLSTDVVNNKGAQLPSTGGMGTTIFYVLGSILVLGTAVLFVVKKRMSVEE